MDFFTMDFFIEKALLTIFPHTFLEVHSDRQVSYKERERGTTSETVVTRQSVLRLVRNDLRPYSLFGACWNYFLGSLLRDILPEILCKNSPQIVYVYLSKVNSWAEIWTADLPLANPMVTRPRRPPQLMLECLVERPRSCFFSFILLLSYFSSLQPIYHKTLLGIVDCSSRLKKQRPTKINLQPN